MRVNKMTKEEFAYLVIDSISCVRTRDKHALLSIYETGENFIDNFTQHIDKVKELLSEKGFLELNHIMQDKSTKTDFFNILKDYDCNFVLHGGENYPECFYELEEPPFVLYYRGNIKLLDDNTVFIAGTRSATSYGITCTKDFTESFVENGLTPLVGISDGIDTAVIEQTLDIGGSVVVLCASGIDSVTPSINSKLLEEVECSGLVISEFAPFEGAQKYHYVLRNRLFAVLSEVAVLIEAESGSNALSAVALSGDYGKEVFALPGNITSPRSSAPNKLISDGYARCLINARDVVEIFKADYVFKPAKNVILEDYEKNILALLDKEAVHFDILCEKANLTSGELVGKLLVMEAKKYIKKLPGNFYQVVR